MNVWKKAPILALVALVLGLVPVMAGGKQEAPAAKQAGPVSISYWYPGADKTSDEHYAKAVKDFMADNPGIKVEATILPANAQDIETKLNAAKLSNTFPDVFLAYLVYMGTRGARGDFAALDELAAAWDGKDDIFPSTLEMGKFQGKLVGLGFAPAPEILTYRKDFFKEAGLDPEKPPRTWEELAAYAEKLTKRDASGSVKVAGLDIPAVTPALVFLEPFMRQNGSKVVDELNQKPAFTDAGAVEALEYLVALKKKNVSIPYNYQKKDEVPFMSGRAAMSYLQTSMIQNIINRDPGMKEKLGFAPVIGRKQKMAFCGYRLFSLGAGTKQKEAAWKFITYMMSSGQMWKRYAELQIPVVRKSLRDRFIADNSRQNAAIYEYVEFGKGKAVVPWTSLMNNFVSNAYEEAMNGRKSPGQALADAQKALEAELARIK